MQRLTNWKYENLNELIQSPSTLFLQLSCLHSFSLILPFQPQQLGFIYSDSEAIENPLGQLIGRNPNGPFILCLVGVSRQPNRVENEGHV